MGSGNDPTSPKPLSRSVAGYTAALRAACRSLGLQESRFWMCTRQIYPCSGEESVRKVSILASVMALTLGVGVCASSVGLLGFKV